MDIIQELMKTLDIGSVVIFTFLLYQGARVFRVVIRISRGERGFHIGTSVVDASRSTQSDQRGYGGPGNPRK